MDATAIMYQQIGFQEPGKELARQEPVLCREALTNFTYTEEQLTAMGAASLHPGYQAVKSAASPSEPRIGAPQCPSGVVAIPRL